MVERVDRRTLGAIRPVDAVTGALVTHAMRIEGDGLSIVRARSGNYAISATGLLGSHVTAFVDPPAEPPAESIDFEIFVEDPARRYLPRRTTVSLPRPWDPGNGVRDLMEPIVLPIAPAASQQPAPGWAVVDASVEDSDALPVPGALVEVLLHGGGGRLTWGLTNARGEARVAVPGLPRFREVENGPGDEDDEIVTSATRVRVRVTADPARPWPVDPAELEAGGGDLRRQRGPVLEISPGQATRAPFTLNLG